MAGIGDVIAYANEDVDGTSVPTVRIDEGGGNAKTAGHFGPAGDDSPPLPDDVAVHVDAGGSGRKQAVGYQDPKNPSKANPGERLLRARNPQGEVVLEVWLKGDGSFVVESHTGAALEMKTSGTVVLNAPDVRLGTLAGKAVACVGDLVAVSVPSLLSSAPGAAVVPAPPVLPNPNGSYPAVGQIISGSSVTKSA